MPRRERRAVVIVLDGVGAGELPDAASYGDAGANTLANVAHAAEGLRLPNLGAMGLGNILPLDGVPPTPQPTAAWGRMAERSAGKDTTTGHWEMMGLTLDRPFPVYPHGFPEEILEPFAAQTGRGWLGNEPASGTEILQRLGDEHVRTGAFIVYTSADSVFQIAAHEDVVPLEELYAACRIARELLTQEHAVGRVIARPFTGPDAGGTYVRTHARRDFALSPSGVTALDMLANAGVPTFGVGKIGEVFAWQGICESPHVLNNMDCFDRLVARVASPESGFVFANLVDFDMVWGHRNDPKGFARGLAEVDARLPELAAAMEVGDLLIVTADHGCDPTTPSTDHSREYVPLLATLVGTGAGSRRSLGTRETFADVGATVLDYYGVPPHAGAAGTSFLGMLEG